jgi:hypothetical protein
MDQLLYICQTERLNLEQAPLGQKAALPLRQRCAVNTFRPIKISWTDTYLELFGQN